MLVCWKGLSVTIHIDFIYFIVVVFLNRIADITVQHNDVQQISIRALQMAFEY